MLFTGSAVMQESVFFHQASRTLIVTDLIENFAPQHFSPLQRNIAKVVGILAPNGKMPLDWRLTFQFNKAEAKAIWRAYLRGSHSELLWRTVK
ncbi:hypothetical protein JCM19238_5653 [Vibrio ponticus]|nr:hypothetical protein JCM19238_5653 [Vibrio ponticus]